MNNDVHDSPRSDDRSADVLIIGSGIMGSAVARLVRAEHPLARIIMVEGGSVIGDTPGLHLHESTVPEIASIYRGRVASGIQSLYTGAELSEAVAGRLEDLEPGMYGLATLGEQAHQMPGAALAWNVGGMGVHWTASAPWPAGDEVFSDGDEAQWAEDLETARTLLNVHAAAMPLTEPGRAVLRVLDDEFSATGPDDRRPQGMPMAAEPTEAGLVRTGPSVIFPPIATGGDEEFELRTGTIAVSLLHAGSRVSGARVREISTGRYEEIDAHTTIVCADVLRTPQLLFASGIRPEALGRYLNEHPFITSQVLMDLDRFGFSLDDLPRIAPGEWANDAIWLPQNGAEQPFHGQVMNRVFIDDDDRALAYAVAVSFYTPVESRAENRLVFSETESDVSGLPRFTVEFAYSDTDQEFIEAGLAETERIARLFGPFDPEVDRAVLAPGSSLHQTGTVRMGAVNDGTSVCDPNGRVWDFDNLYLAGNGVVPTALVCNSTLTGMITAVRAARAVSGRLRDLSIDSALAGTAVA